MPAQVRIKVDGIVKAKSDLDGNSKAVDKGSKRAIQDTTIKVQGMVKRVFGTRRSVPGVGEGRLRRGIIQFVERTSRGWLGTIGVRANVHYGRIQEEGGTTPPMTIVPRVKKALAFPVGFGAMASMAATGRGATPIQAQKRARGARGGDFVIVKSVEHPGSKIPARPYLGPTLDEDRPNIPDRFRKRIAQAIGG